MSKSIEDKFRKLTDIQHVLARPTMYIGSVKPKTTEEYVMIGDKFVKEELTYIPGFLKIFDEIISNSVDEHKRDTSNLNEIHVSVDFDNNFIKIWDNGGIPVVMHKVEKMWVPELIFSNLKAGSNFNDEEDRVVAGTNGVGSTLTNIYSQKFTIKTSDGKNQFTQTFTDNMNKRSKSKIEKSTKHFTEITYYPDFSQFSGMTQINEDSFQMIYKRIHELAATNSKLKLKLIVIKDKKRDTEIIKYRNFKDYVSKYADEYFYEDDSIWKIAIAPSKDGYQQVSYVNSVETKDAGTHVEYIYWQIINGLRTLIKKKHKVDIRPHEIKSHMFIFVNTTIINPMFESQTKEKLVTEYRDFGSTYQVSDKLIKKIFASEVVSLVLDWYAQKKQAEERAQLRKLNKNLDTKKVLKLIDAKKKTNRDECIIGFYEGNSAVSAVRKFRDSQIIGAYPLRGKFINVHEMTNAKIIQNEEVKDIMAAIGLKLGESPKDLRYGKIYIYTDADHDGTHIAASLVNFFYKYWPELFEEGKVFKVMTPILVAKKGKTIKNFYHQSDFDKWCNTNDVSKWEVEYKKGLASLEDSEYAEIIKNPYLVKLTKDIDSTLTLQQWFSKDPTPRKVKLLENN